MNFYFLLIVFLYTREINARVVPLDFKQDKCKNLHLSVPKKEVIDESPPSEVVIVGRNLQNTEQKNDLALLDSENTASVFENSSRNARKLHIDLATKEMEMQDELVLENVESSEISNVLDEEFKSVAEFISKNNSDSIDSFENLQVNGSLNGETAEDLNFKNETFITSTSDSEQGNHLALVKIEDKSLNDDTLNQIETFTASEVIYSDQDETLAVSENINSNQKKTFVASEVIYSDQDETFKTSAVNNIDQNDSIASFDIINGSNINISESEHLRTGKRLEVFQSDSNNIIEELKSEKLASENLESTNDSEKTAGGMFSGFEFLINSEVARNAAKAMEVFNFSDPLTDHIIEENEFHSFLPAFNPVENLDSSNQTNLQTSMTILNNSGLSNEIGVDFNTSLQSENETSFPLNEAEPNEIKNSSLLFNVHEPQELVNETEKPDLAEKDEPATSEVPSSGTSEANSQLALETTISEQSTNVSKSNADLPECPPTGWCILWFLSQDTCAVNEHCLGNRICCKIGCSKTCIEI